MKPYDHKKIELKWQKKWDKDKAFAAVDGSKKKKWYSLIEFPYPSGDGLHVGHVRSMTAMDIISRKRRRENFNVLYPIGWDASGLPTENYAIKTGKDPSVVTKENSDNYRKQIKSLGLSFDWSREINTMDPKYYRWTQWIFLQFLKAGLAYKKKMAINWCPKDLIGLANEEVIDGKCERCGTPVEKREKEQWMLAITKYADRLDRDLDLVDYLPEIKTQQRNWIGKSEGALIKFEIKCKVQNVNSKSMPSTSIGGEDKSKEQRAKSKDEEKKEIYNKSKENKSSNFPIFQSSISSIEVFTTRPDTLFGVTYVVLAPEHPLVRELLPLIKNRSEALVYMTKVKKESDIERTDATREKTGVELKGVKAVNPVNGEEVPVYIADYVLADYGTGAVMAVPAHDDRDWEFAKKYGLPVREVIKDLQKETNLPFTGEGKLIDSAQFNDKKSDEIKKDITAFAGGQWISKYKLRDWIFSRQRYWGEPIPVVHCEKCGIVPIPEKDLPVKLPPVKNYKPTETGESPLAAISKWVNTKCPRCNGPAKRETDTMPNWAGSSWYYLRYIDPKNSNKFADMKKLKYWTPVDWYNGGMEHVTLHLLYSRFWHKFLFDQGLVPTSEPYTKRTAHGFILGPGGEKMSKSRGNVINPDEIIEKVGADSLRLYEMFMGPFDQAISWDENGIVGCRRFLERVWKLQDKVKGQSSKPKAEGQKLKVEDPTDIELSTDRGLVRAEHKSLEPRAYTRNDQPEATYDLAMRVSAGLEKVAMSGGAGILPLIHKTIKKVSEDIENMRFNTAVSALMILLNEFEKEGTVAQENFEILLQLLAPFAPHITEELWSMLPNKKSIHLEPWPTFDPKLLIESSVKMAVQVNGKTRAEMEVAADLDDEAIKVTALALEPVKKWLNGNVPSRIIVVKGRLVNIVYTRAKPGTSQA